MITIQLVTLQNELYPDQKGFDGPDPIIDLAKSFQITKDGKFQTQDLQLTTNLIIIKRIIEEIMKVTLITIIHQVMALER